MIPYIGDISKQDAAVLREYAAKSKSILEFGVGASTQVMRSYCPGKMISIETDPQWISKTQDNLKLLNVDGVVDFLPYEKWVFDSFISNQFDLIFDDGVDSFRRDFALNTWRTLKVGGFFLFHDQRRSGDIHNMTALVNAVSAEIKSIYININHSNITVIEKKIAEHYENWNEVESRLPWEYGAGDPDTEEVKRRLSE